MNIEDNSLALLKCAQCDLPLSVPPVSLNLLNNFICGRCNKHGVPIVIYELLAKKFAFPCRYRSSGCQRFLPWGFVETHEVTCTNAPYYCPSLIMPYCKWQGNINDLAKHVEECHSEDVLVGDYLSVNLKKEKMYCKLLKTTRGNYLVHYIVKSNGTVRLGITEIAGKSLYKGTEYVLKVCSQNFEKKFYFVSKKAATYGSPCLHQNDVTETILRFLSSDISVINFKIIFKRNESKEKREVFKLLSCHGCKQGVRAIVYVCVEGHDFCNSCSLKLKQCSTCSSSFTKIRNYAAEEIISEISQYCKNEELGCKYSASAEEVERHETTCKYYKCPLQVTQNYCKWSGKYDDLIKHCKTEHIALGTSNDELICDLKVENGQFFVLIYYDGVFFRLCRKDEDGNCFINVQFVGCNDTPHNYSYEFTLISINDNRKRISVQNVCQNYLEEVDAFENCHKIPFSLLDEFSANEICKYDIKINKNM